jgi:Flp pilus assembly protein TadD
MAEVSRALDEAEIAAAKGQLGLAQRLLEQSLDLGADPAEVHWRLGKLHAAAGHRGEAVDSFELAAHLRPDRHGAWLELSAIYLDLAQYDEALRTARCAAACPDADAASFSNLGMAARTLGLYAEAEQALRQALAMDAAHHAARVNLGLVLKDLGRIDEALAQFESVIADHPGDDEARWNLAVMRLARGDFRAGWRDYEKRWLQRGVTRRRFDFPSWDGTAPGDKTVLVFAEQGIGDEIMFASCIPDALRMGGRWILECSPRLQTLFQRSFPRIEVLPSPLDADAGWRDRLRRVDLQAPAGSLPRLLGREAGTFPAHAGYLHADPARVAAWKERLDALGPGLKIGVSWRGGDPRTGRQTRSIELPRFAPLFALRGCRFVSIQYGEVQDECAAARREFGMPFPHWPEAQADFDATAALVSALDLVVTVTTAAVHLGGALGKRVWVMVPVSPEWRYGLSGEGMPWYPGARLFRQSAPLDWAPVIERIARELRVLAGG